MGWGHRLVQSWGAGHRHGCRPRSRVAEAATGNQKTQGEAAVCGPQPAPSSETPDELIAHILATPECGRNTWSGQGAEGLVAGPPLQRRANPLHRDGGFLLLISERGRPDPKAGQ